MDNGTACATRPRVPCNVWALRCQCLPVGNPSHFCSPCRFEVNAMLRCRKKGAAMGGVGDSMPPHVCQLFNGIVNHEEIDQ